MVGVIAAMPFRELFEQFAFSGVFVFFGLVFVAVGVHRIRERRRIRSAEPTPLSAVSPGQTVKVSGTVRPASGTHPTPVGDEESVVTMFETDAPKDKPTMMESFYLEDDGTRALVPDENPIFDVTSDATKRGTVTEEELEPGESPIEVGDSVKISEDVDTYTQMSLQPGDRAVVYGTAREPQNRINDVDVVVGKDGDDGTFYVLDDGDAVSSSRKYVLALLVGLVFLVVGVAVLLGIVEPKPRNQAGWILGWW